MTGLLAVGDRVTDGRRTGEIRHAGPCEWHGCRFGDQCVTIQFNGGHTTENRHADGLVPA